jgi:hypothetical protein
MEEDINELMEKSAKDALLFINGGERATQKALISKSKDLSKGRLNIIKQTLLENKNKNNKISKY